MVESNKNFGLIEGRSYVHEDYNEWGHGVFFIDKNGSLKIDFSRAGIKSILSFKSAGKLKMLPEKFMYFNKPAKLIDGRLVVLMGGEISPEGDEFYTVFSEIEPRVFHVNGDLTPVIVKDQAVMSLMNNFFKFKRKLPLNANGIRMVRRRSQRITHCYNCKESRLDSNTDFECASCGWIICPACGACDCGRSRRTVSFDDIFGV